MFNLLYNSRFINRFYRLTQINRFLDFVTLSQISIVITIFRLIYGTKLDYLWSQNNRETAKFVQFNKTQKYSCLCEPFNPICPLRLHSEISFSDSFQNDRNTNVVTVFLLIPFGNNSTEFHLGNNQKENHPYDGMLLIWK